MSQLFVYEKRYKESLNALMLARSLKQRVWDGSQYELKQLTGVGMVTAKVQWTPYTCVSAGRTAGEEKYFFSHIYSSIPKKYRIFRRTVGGQINRTIYRRCRVPLGIALTPYAYHTYSVSITYLNGGCRTKVRELLIAFKFSIQVLVRLEVHWNIRSRNIIM